MLNGCLAEAGCDVHAHAWSLVGVLMYGKQALNWKL